MFRFFQRFFGATVAVQAEAVAIATEPLALPAPVVVADEAPPATAEPVAPKKKRAAVKKPLDRDVWAEYKAPRWRQKTAYERTHFKVTFQGGEVFRVSHPSDKRKPFNRGGAVNVASSFYKLRLSARWANEKGLSGQERNDKRDRYERKLRVPPVETIEVFTDATRHLMN